jgi:hypothetical protein
VAVGPSELGQHEAVKPVALATGHGVARTHRDHLIGMHRDHRQSAVQQPLDQQPIRALQRDQLHPQPHQPHAQRAQPRLVVTVAAPLHNPPDVDTLLTSPIDPPAAGPDRALNPRLPDTGCADVGVVDVVLVLPELFELLPQAAISTLVASAARPSITLCARRGVILPRVMSGPFWGVGEPAVSVSVLVVLSPLPVVAGPLWVALTPESLTEMAGWTARSDIVTS